MNAAPRGLPSDQQALYDAYVEATGQALYLSTPRRFVLRALVDRGITAADVRAVLAALQKKIARGDGGFTDSSMSFRNAMEPDKLEERALLLRQQKSRSKGARPKPLAPRTQMLPDGSTITRLDDAPTPDAGALKDMVRKALGRP